MKTKVLHIASLVVLFFLLSANLTAATYFSIASGNWSNATGTVWSLTSGGAAVAANVKPVAGDAVTIERGFTVTVDAASACTSLQLGGTATNNAGTLTFSGTSTLTVSGAVYVGNSGNAARDGAITFTSGSAMTVGSLTLGGTAATPGQGTITMTAGGTLSVGGTITVGAGAGTWTPGTGTVILTATNTLPSTLFTSFNNLQIAGGTTTIGASISCASILLGKTGSAGAGTLTFSGSPTVTVSGAVTLGNNVSGSNGTITFVSGSVLNAGSLTMGGSVSGAGGAIDMTAGGTLGIGGAISYGTASGTFTPGTGKVVLSGTNTLTAAVFSSFNNLEIAGGTTTISSNLTIASLQLGKTAAAGAGALTFSGTPTVSVPGAVLVGSTISGSSGTITFTSGSTLNAGSLKLGGTNASATGTIDMALGGTLSLGGAITLGTGTKTWTPGTGTVIFTADNTLPTSVFTTFNALQIKGGTTTTGVSLTSIASLSIDANCTFTTASSHAITATSITINGTYTNGSSGTITTPTWICNGTYNHATSSQILPLGSTTTSWAANSNCNITGSYTSATVFANFIGQTFGNVTFNPSSMTNTVCMYGASGSVTVQGNFSINQTGGSTLYLRQSGQQFVGVLNINGNFNMAAGIFDLHNGLTTPTTSTVNLKGNFTLSGTSTMTQTTIQAGSTVNFNFMGTTTQTVSISSSATISSQATTSTCAIKFAVANGSTIDIGTSVLTGNNNTSFTLSAGASIITANTGGLSSTGSATGSIQVTGTRTYSATANYTFNNLSLGQVTGNGVTAANNLVISNTTTPGLAFSNTIAISGNMSVTAGAHVDLGNVNSSAATLTLGGIPQATSTSYGGTNSAAATKPTAYFNAPLTTGILAVSLPAPSNLSYNSPFNFRVGELITPQYPTVTGVVISYSIIPALPAALAFNTTTGAITGTPSANSASTNYTVTATNTAGSTTCTVTISVGNYRYAVNAATADWNTAIWSTTSGGPVDAAVPVSGDIVFIGDASTNRTVTIPAGYNAACGSLTMGNYSAATVASLSMTGNGSLTVGNDLLMNRPNATATTVINVNAGSLTVGGTLKLANSDLTPNASATLINQVNISTGTVTTKNLLFNGQSAPQSQVVFSGAGTLHISGDMTFGFILGTLTPATGTVDFNGAAQSVPYVSAVTYNHLSLSGSGVKTLPAALVSIPGNLNLSGTASATTAANLAIGGTLNVGGGTTFATGTNFTLGVTGATSVTGTLLLAGTGAKTFSGNVTVNALGVWNETGIAAINYAGNLQHDGATFTALSGIHTFSGTGKTISGTSEISIPNVTVASPGNYINSGTLTVSTALSGTGSLTNGNGTIGTLNLGGSFGITGFVANPVGNTVNYTGTGQVLKVMAYHHLTLSGGAETFGAITTIAGNLTLSGSATATATTAAALAVGGNLSVGSGATFNTGVTSTWTLGVSGTTSVTGTLNLAGTGAKTFTGDVTINSGGVWNETGIAAVNYAGSLQHDGTTFTALSGTHTFTGSGKTISGSKEISIPNVTITSPGNYTNSGTLTVSTALSGTGSLINGNGTIGTLNLGGTCGITTFDASATYNSVNYTGTAQTAKVATYHNLTLSGSGAKTFATSPTVNGTLSMEGTATAKVTVGLVTYSASAKLQYKGSAVQPTGDELLTTFAGSGGVKINNTHGVALIKDCDLGANPLTIGDEASGSSFDDGGHHLTATGTLNLTSGTYKVNYPSLPGFTTCNISAGTTVEYDADADQTVKGIHYSNLTIYSSSGTHSKTADADITVDGILNLNSTNASTTHGCLEMGSHTLNMGDGATTGGTGDVSGIVKRTSFALNTPYTFGNQFTTLTLTTGTLPASVSAKIVLTTTPLVLKSTAPTINSINRYYDFCKSGGDGTTISTLNLHYLPGEVSGTPVLDLWDHDVVSPFESDDKGHSNGSATDHWVGVANLALNYIAPASDFGTKYMTLGATNTIDFVWSGYTDSDWTNKDNWVGGVVPGPGNHVIIPEVTGINHHHPTLPANTTIGSITINPNGELDGGTGTLSLDGTTGAWENLAGVTGFVCGTSTVKFITAGATMSDPTNFYNVEVGTGASLSLGTNNTMRIAGALTLNGVLNAAGNHNTIEYNGTSGQTVVNPNGSTSGYHNLILSGSGAKTMPGTAMTIYGDFEMAGTATATAGNALTFAGNVTLGSGTTFAPSTFTHSVSGNWTNNGATFTPGTSTINFNNTSLAQSINGTAGSQSFHNIEIDKGSTALSVGGSTTSLAVNDLTETSGDFSAPATLTVNGNATLTSGNFTAGATTDLKGNWSNNGGTFTAGSGTVTFDGSSAQTINGANTFNNLTIYKTASGEGVTANAPQTVNAILNLDSPNHSGTQGCLSMADPNQLFMGPSATTTGTGDVSGYITRNSFVLGTNYTFGNQFTLMNFSVGPLPSTVSVEVYLTSAMPTWMGTNKGIWRYYDVTQTGGTADTRLRFNVHYLVSELHSATEANLDLFDHHASGPYAGLTHDHGRSDNSTVDNWVGFSNVGLVFLGVATEDDHLWTLGDGITANTSIWIGGSPSGPTDWNLPGNWEGGVPTSTSNVIIPAAAYAPILPNTSTTLVSMNIGTGGVFDANTGSPTLTITGGAGAWVNTGTFNSGSSTVDFTGGASATISGSTDFNNIIIAGGTTLTLQTGSTMGIEGTLTMTGTLNAATNSNTIVFYGSGQTITNPNGSPAGFYNLTLAGTASTVSGAITVSGDFTKNGTYTAVGSTITFNGTTQTMTGTSMPLTYNNLIISSSVSTTVPAGKSLTVNGTTTLTTGTGVLVLKSDATGTASFIDNGTISSGGTAKIERYLTPYDLVPDLKFHFISSPVSSTQAIAPEFIDLSSVLITDFYKWNEVANEWTNYRGATYSSQNMDFGDSYNFVPGKGYMVAYPPPGPIVKNFVGTPNTSTGGIPITCTHASGGWNLIGNPFPSSINWAGISKGDGMDAALYYYDNATPGYKYYTYFSGGLGGASQYIAPMQGFMVHAKVSGTTTVTIPNSARTHTGQDVFYKNATLETNILDLKVEGSDCADYARVCFYDQATDNFDGEFDAYKLFSYSPGATELYSVTADNTSLAINTLPASVMEGGAVPVSFNPGSAGSFTLTAETMGTFAPETYITLEDKTTSTLQKLNDNPIYAFTATPQDAAGRFVLHFKNATAIHETRGEDPFTVSVSDGIIKVETATAGFAGKVRVTDIIGRTLAMGDLVSGTPVQFNLKAKTGIYLVTVYTSTRSFSRKVLLY